MNDMNGKYLRFLFCFMILEVAIAEAFNDEGNTEYRKGEYKYATICYTEGINTNCKDENLIAILFTNRATVRFQSGENCSVFFQLGLMFYVFFVLRLGH